VLPYFKKSENINVEDLLQSPYHGHDGPLNVERSSWISKLFNPFVDACNELGYKHNDPDGKKQLGVSRVTATMHKGRRWSAASAFLKPAIYRPNLHISKRSWVVKILFHPVHKRAFGVEFLKNKKRFIVRASKEIIISAGVIGSPQLLMLSGIGPKKHLKSLGIPVVQDLAVGYNLQDHPSFPGLVFPVDEPVTVLQNELQTPQVYIEYFLNNTGQLTLPGGSEGIAFVKTNFSFQGPSKKDPVFNFRSNVVFFLFISAADYPDIELVLGPGSLVSDSTGFIQKLVGITDEYFDESWGAITGKHAFSIVPVLMRPKSRGRVWLRSTNPFHWPHLQPNYYQHDDDMRVMVEGIKLAVTIGESKSFQKFGSKLYDKPNAGCDHLPFRSDKYFECCVQQIGSSLQHQVFNNKMTT
jgi:choline dehydrogenase-like flavoprotein